MGRAYNVNTAGWHVIAAHNKHWDRRISRMKSLITGILQHRHIYRKQGTHNNCSGLLHLNKANRGWAGVAGVRGGWRGLIAGTRGGITAIFIEICSGIRNVWWLTLFLYNMFSAVSTNINSIYIHTNLFFTTRKTVKFKITCNRKFEGLAVKPQLLLILLHYSLHFNVARWKDV